MNYSEKYRKKIPLSWKVLALFENYINWKAVPLFIEKLNEYTDFQSLSKKDFEGAKKQLLTKGLLKNVPNAYDLQIFQFHPLFLKNLNQQITNKEHDQLETAFAYYYQRMSKTLLKTTYSQKNLEKWKKMTALLEFEVENLKKALVIMYPKKEKVDDLWSSIQVFYTKDKRYTEALTFMEQVVLNLEKYQYNQRHIEFIQAIYSKASIYVWLHKFEDAQEIFIKILNTLDKIEEQKDQSLNMADLYLAIGTTYKQVFNYSESIDTYKKALAIYEKLNLKSRIVGILGGMADSYLGLRNFEKAKSYYERVLKMIEGQNDWVNQASIKHGLGRLYDYTGYHEKADVNFKDSLEFYFKLGDTRGIGDTYANMGANANRWGQFEKSRKYYQLAIPYFIEINDQERIGILFSNIGTIELYAKNYKIAADYYEKSILALKGFNDKNGQNIVSGAYHNLALVHYTTGNFKKSLKKLLRAIKINIELLNRDELTNLLKNMLYIKQETKDEGFSNPFHKELKQALHDFETEKNLKGIASISFNLGYLSYHLKQVEDSDKYFRQAIMAYQKIGDAAGFALSCSNLGNLHGLLKNYEEAKKFLTKALETYTQIKDVSNMLDTLKFIESMKEIPEFGYQIFRKEVKQILNNSYTLEEAEALIEKSTSIQHSGAPTITI